MSATSVSALSETVLLLVAPNTARADGPLGEAGLQFASLFQFPLAGVALQTAGPFTDDGEGTVLFGAGIILLPVAAGAVKAVEETATRLYANEGVTKSFLIAA